MRHLREDFKEHLEHDAANFAALHEVLKKIDEKLDPIVDVYKAAMLSKGFVVGFASIVLAIGAIGAGFIWLINSVIHK